MSHLIPDPFLEIRYEDLGHVGLCAGYEGGLWRAKKLADHIFDWLPYVALDQEHQLRFGQHNWGEMIELAAAHIYNTKKTKNRGEIGEILLHIACVSNHGAFPILCKLILKTASNDTVKGFDGVHIKVEGDTFELWLGESKFYTSPQRAIREAVTSMRDHIIPAFLDTEKAMIIGHIGKDVPMREQVLPLFRKRTSSDELLKMAVFPVLIGYESAACGAHSAVCDHYKNELAAEITQLRSYFGARAKALPLKFRLIFVPMAAKAEVINRFDQKLQAHL
jgi:hypothetical protein